MRTNTTTNFRIPAQGSCTIAYNQIKKIKNIIFKNNTSWKNNKVINNQLNGQFYVPDEDYTVIDLDDMESDQNKYIFNNFKNSCGLIVKTKKGYHLWFEYEDKIEHINKLKSVDIIHKGRKMIFIPPSYYETESEKITYQYIKNEEPTKMPEELVNYILSRYEQRRNETVELLKNSTKIIKETTSKAEPKKMVADFKELKSDEEIVSCMLESLKEYRSDDYHDWFRVLMILKNEGYKYELFDIFSRKSNKYDSGCIDHWNSYKPSDAKNKLTMASLWYMLKEDNPQQFIKLKMREALKDYEQREYTPTGEFSTVEFLKIWEEDTQQLGHHLIDHDCLCISNSFKYFNAHHSKISNLGYVRINYNLKLRTIIPLNASFISSLNEAYIQHGDKTYNFMDLYDKNRNKSIFDKLGFSPLDNDKNMLNYFNGFKYQNNNKCNFEKVKPYIDFVKHVINNEQQAEHFLNWVAHIIQRPNIKQTTCYVFYSYKHGVGKNTITKILNKLLTGYAYDIKNADELAGKFNGESVGKLLCVGDEIKTFKSGENLNNIVKNLISQEYRSIEFKGKDKVTGIVDLIHYIFTTNNEFNFYIEQSDRRFNLIECNKELMSEKIYKLINELAKDDEFLANLHSFFMERDLSNYDAFHPFVSNYKKRLEKRSIPADIQCLKEIKASYCDQFVSNKQIIQNITAFMSFGKKPRSGKVIITSLVDLYGMKQTRPYNEDGTRGTTYGFSFIQSTKVGKANWEALNNIFGDDDDEIDNLVVGVSYDEDE